MPPGPEMADAYTARMLERCRLWKGVIFVGVDGGEVAGFVCVYARARSEEPDEGPKEYGLVSDLVVLPAFRGSGMGRALLERAESHARRADVQWLRVGVLSSNEAARTLYSRAGYRPYSEYLEKELERRDAKPERHPRRAPSSRPREGRSRATAGQPSFGELLGEDLPELEAMALALYAEDAHGEPMSSDKVRRTVRELARHPEKGRIVLARVADAVVGYAIVVHAWSNELGGDVAIVDELYVKPPWRGEGIGTALLAHVASSSGGRVKSLALEVTPVNEQAMGYYLRRGFAPASNRQLLKRL